MKSIRIAAACHAAFAALLIAFAAQGAFGASDASPSTKRRNADGCMTLVANAFYTGPYLGVDNQLSASALARDLRCGEAFRNSKRAYKGGFVTIFGGSAIARTDSLYKGVMDFAEQWTKHVVRSGGRYPVLTGAGPGVMEAGNRGALKARGPSIGYTTYYGPARQQKNPALAYQTYNDSQIVTDGLILSSIEMREILMINHSAVAIVAPGGTGTEWELFEVLDGLKNAQIDSIPVYLIGNRQRNWASFDSLLADMIRRGTVASSVLSLFTYVENPVDVIPLLCARLRICEDGEKKNGRK